MHAKVHVKHKTSTRESAALATLALRPEGLQKCRRLAGIEVDKDLAARMRIDGGQLSRVLLGKSAPGPRFIAGLLEVFGTEWFDDLFVVLPDDEEPAA